jgi:hypothetical protein
MEAVSASTDSSFQACRRCTDAIPNVAPRRSVSAAGALSGAVADAPAVDRTDEVNANPSFCSAPDLGLPSTATLQSGQSVRVA